MEQLEPSVVRIHPPPQQPPCPQWTENLPLIVWLKGDEPYFGEFSLDADAVMQQLGIKRSRLTQISGTELRVGRTRIDRYIRPVYRPCDISDYQQWTRATASHHKSSTLLEQAALKLEDSSKDFATQLAQWGTALTSRHRELLQQHASTLGTSIRFLLQQSLDLSQRHLQATGVAQQHDTRQLQRQLQLIISTLQELHQSLGDFSSLAPSLEEIRGSTRYLQASMLQLQSSGEQNQKDWQQNFSRLESRLAQLAAEQEQYFSPASPPARLRRIHPPRPRGTTLLSPSSRAKVSLVSRGLPFGKTAKKQRKRV